MAPFKLKTVVDSNVRVESKKMHAPLNGMPITHRDRSPLLDEGKDSDIKH